ncbi:hypothetical protein AK95_30225 [Paenibacillus sp. LC231]|uniref:hypothetical protein n=1 Tax=Paenibacillus sp. LC231 TaxID=1120679 RepID=UPI0008DD7E40|nr:hypothetical protein [Paenibacillus sp. LC231]OIB02452.1 hypothetical protein AK95_30225 [Paenibacillus sp. LC231]
MKWYLSHLSLNLFVCVTLFTLYSFMFPPEAGSPFQRLWFAAILLLSPVGILLALVSRNRDKLTRIHITAIVGHSVMLLFLFLYMTLGYLILGV